MNRQFFTGKKVLVMGLGRFGGGVDVCRFLCKAGAKVTVTDLSSAEQLKDSIGQLEKFGDIEYHLGGHLADDFEQADIIVVNPAVPEDNEFLKLAASHNKFVTSQINIFFELCGATIIGITGANGKSTTAALTAHLLRVAGCEKVWLSGNIGSEPLLSILEQIGDDDLVVLELSSFQTQALAQIQKAPQISVLTNLVPNHLDRHGTFANYCLAKENMFKFQELGGNRPAVSIFGAEDEIGLQWFEKYRNQTGRTCIKFSAGDISKEIRNQFGLPGRANLSNLAAAVTIARHFGADDDQIKNCLGEFQPLPHRLELVAEINGVSWYNDSIATTPQSTIAAIDAFEQPAIIIAGGYDKNLAFDQLGEKIAQSCKAVILIGQTAGKIAGAIENKLATEVTENTEKKVKVEIVKSLADAVNTAKELAVSGDIVLLSPACASYDMFDNFEHRGNEFARLVREISG